MRIGPVLIGDAVGYRVGEIAGLVGIAWMVGAQGDQPHERRNAKFLYDHDISDE